MGFGPFFQVQGKTMRKMFLIAVLCMASVCGNAQTEPNITIRLHVDSYINAVEQMVYVWSSVNRNTIVSDSVRIVPGQNSYLLKGCLLYEQELNLTFTRRGPAKVSILAHPHEEIELEITEDDDLPAGSTYKSLIKGHEYNNLFVAFQNAAFGYTGKKNKIKDAMSVYGLSADQREMLADSLNKVMQENLDYLRYTAAHTPSPLVAFYAHLYLWNRISAEEHSAIGKANYMRFSDYPPFEWAYNETFPKETDESKKTWKRMAMIRQNRMILRQSELQADTLRLGDQPDLMLVDSLGDSTPLSAYRGKYVLLELWASWCAPCIKAMPNILLAQRRFADDFVCCAITIDKSVGAWKRRIEAAGLQSLKHYKATDANGHILPDMRRLAAHGIVPQNYLLDRDGRVIAIDIYDDELIEKLKELTGR